MPTQTGQYGVTFPDGTLQTTAAFGNGTATVFTFNASATWTRPSSGAMTRIQLWGGGGGGASYSAGSYGGAGGGYNEYSVPTALLAATVNITVGAGGVGGSGAGGTGGVTLFPIAVMQASVAGTTLSVSELTSGLLFIGQTITGSGIASGTHIVAYGTGSGGLGTYILNASQGSLSTRTLSANLAAYGGSGGNGSTGAGVGGGQTGIASPVIMTGWYAGVTFYSGAKGGGISQPDSPTIDYPPTGGFWHGGGGAEFFGGAGSVWGGGGGAASGGDTTNYGGSSLYGGKGGTWNFTSNGQSGTFPSGGGAGGGTYTAGYTGGAGAGGRVILTVA